MNDINDDELTLYYYKDGLSKDERLRLSNALAADSGLAARYKSLSDTLSQLADVEPGAGLNAIPTDIMQRFHKRFLHATDGPTGHYRETIERSK